MYKSSILICLTFTPARTTISRRENRYGDPDMKHTLTDIRTRRVLSTLDRSQRIENKEFGGSKSLKEVTLAHNKYYPPGILGKLVGMGMSETEMKSRLDFLIGEGLVSKELLSFTDQCLEMPELHYHLSQAGIQYLRGKK